MICLRVDFFFSCGLKVKKVKVFFYNLIVNFFLAIKNKQYKYKKTISQYTISLYKSLKNRYRYKPILTLVSVWPVNWLRQNHHC